jgi:hypothetical protein
MTDLQDQHGAPAVAAHVIADDVARHGATARYEKGAGGAVASPRSAALIALGVIVAVGLTLGGLALGGVGPFGSSTGTGGGTDHTPSTVATQPPAPPASVGQFGLGLNNFTVELSFSGLSFTSCPATLQADIPPTFGGGWEFTTTQGATGHPVNVTLSPLPTSPFGDFIDGTISSRGVLTATGDGPYDRLTLTLMLPSALSAGKATTLIPVTGSATVQSHFASGGECTESWSKVTGTVSPPAAAAAAG